MTKLIVRLALVTLLSSTIALTIAAPAEAGEGRGYIVRTH